MTTATQLIFPKIVLEGVYVPNDMPRFNDLLSKEDLKNVHNNFIDLAAIACGDEHAKDRLR